VHTRGKTPRTMRSIVDRLTNQHSSALVCKSSSRRPAGSSQLMQL
jgi:hypothetical protein